MAEAQLQQFLAKVNALNAFVALSEADPALRAALTACSNHHEVVELARRSGFEIGRRWGEPEGTPPAAANLLGGTLPPAGSECTTVLLQTQHWRLERIHSNQASNAPGFWYDQAEHEWVLLLQGTAALRFDDRPSDDQLRAGDSLWISPGRRHRVTATDPDPGTIWLALFWRTA